MSSPSRGDLAAMYLDVLPFDPYPVQEEALLAWFDDNEGVLVCAPTGTGKTLIAEAAMFEALHSGKTAYYTTPLIALTEQKFSELQAAAIRWGFSPDDIGLITGNRKVNPNATILVVVAEILLNRLLHPEGIDFSHVSSVVMDEFHSFNDPERGVVWELSLALLPKHVRLMLLSATVGNAVDFLLWLRREHGRAVQLIQSTERKIPLTFQWVGEELLPDFLEQMQDGTEEGRRTPALVFCFNREECWSVGELLKGKDLLRAGQQKALAARLEEWDWKVGAGPKLKQLLMRGVGVHHAGLLPKYRRRVETLFQEKLLSICVCTETLAAGINLPARSVVMTSLVKGPPGKKTIVDASTAHQIFGRAGRPQFDTSGYVFALAHEDDVKIARWKQQYDQIPEDTKDPNLIRAKKKLKKRAPKRRDGEQYWNEDQFQKLLATAPRDLVSRGELPWRLLAYLITLSPDVNRLITFVRKRLLPPKEHEKATERLTKMLLTLASGEFITLDPPPPEPFVKATRDWPTWEADTLREGEAPAEPHRAGVTTETRRHGEGGEAAGEPRGEDDFGAGIVDDHPAAAPSTSDANILPLPDREGAGGRVAESPIDIPKPAPPLPEPPPAKLGSFGALLQAALTKDDGAGKSRGETRNRETPKSIANESREIYIPQLAQPTLRLDTLLAFRSCHPLFGAFLLDHLGVADRAERIQILESVLEVPGSILPLVRVPPPSEMPPGPLAVQRINPELTRRGLITQAEIDPSSVEPQTDAFGKPIRVWPVPLGDKMRRLFDNEYPGVQDLRTRSVWIAGDLLQVGGDFDKYVRTRDLTKQEGIVFRHLLRMILLCQEFSALTPPAVSPAAWSDEMRWIAETLTESCRQVDPESTDKALETMAAQADVVGSE